MFSEPIAQMLTIAFMLICILSFYVIFKRRWVAFLFGTFLTPILGIIFMMYIYHPDAAYYLFALPYFIIASAILCGIIERLLKK